MCSSPSLIYSPLVREVFVSQFSERLRDRGIRRLANKRVKRTDRSCTCPLSAKDRDVLAVSQAIQRCVSLVYRLNVLRGRQCWCGGAEPLLSSAFHRRLERCQQLTANASISERSQAFTIVCEQSRPYCRDWRFAIVLASQRCRETIEIPHANSIT